MVWEGDGLYRDGVLRVFKIRKTAFLTTESILKEVQFRKALSPKEDKESLDVLLEKMRAEDLVVLNQPKFVALGPGGKLALEAMSEDRAAEIKKELEERLK
jgi:hypothetical protein